MRSTVRLVRLFVVPLLVTATSLQAITYIVPNDRDLVKRSEAIIIATAVESHSDLRDRDRLVTVATLQVEKVLKGSVDGESVQLVEMGGTVGERMTFIPGSPRYESGKRYLVFLRTNRFGEKTTYGFGLGKFEFITDLHGHELLVRGGTDDEMFGFNESDSSQHVEPLRDAGEFLGFVRTVVEGDAPAREDYVVARSAVVFAKFPEFVPRTTRFVPIPLATRPDYLSAGNFRWQSPVAGFVYCCTPTLQPNFPNAVSDASSAMANWNGQGVGVNYTLGSADNTANKGFTTYDCKNTILFNDPNHEITGAAAIGGISTTGGSCVPPPGQPGPPFTYNNLGDGVTYNNTLEADVVVGANGTFSTNEATFIGVLTHELGHTLGFRHSDQTAANDPGTPCNPALIPCTSDAIMNSTIAFNLQSLRPYDVNAVQTVYGAGPVCNAPSIATQPASQSISFGSQANLSVAANGTAPLTYQWYTGNSGNTASPAGGATSTTFHPTPAVTTNYWVRVSNSCNGVQIANSNTAVVTVTCAPPSAGTPQASPSSIASSQSSTLSVNPTGSSPFTYQWYIGNSGVTTTPINGATSSSVMVSPSLTTTYWVRVTGQCAPASDSQAVTVTVAPCVLPTAGTPSASPSSIPTGQSSTISVNPAGTPPFTYQWYIGNSGVTTTPIAGGSNSFVTVSPATTTSYWVRVTGQCAPQSDSPSTTVTVTCAPIAAPGVTAQPQTINIGQSSTLAFNTAGSGPFTIQWYKNGLGDTSSPIAGANGQSTIVSPASSASYWVRVTSQCGTQDASVIVFVNGAPCNAPSITGQPASLTINAGSLVSLTVAATGTAPLTYQWYTGVKGDISHPIAGSTAALITQSPSVTTNYWVRVSNNCNNVQSADSNTATVTIGCSSPSITTQPVNVSAAIGTAATLKVVAAGSSLHYQWFQGVRGDTSKPVGLDSATLITGAISGNTLYWVHVTGACGSPADSNAGTVTALAPPRVRASRH